MNRRARQPHRVLARRMKALDRWRSRVKELMASPDPEKMAHAMRQLERLQAKIAAGAQ